MAIPLNNNFINRQRIIWIDFAKTIGIIIVVYCHIPQPESITKDFFVIMQMPLFFLISGFLHHNKKTIRESFLSYWKKLVIPYILFQFIFFPYYCIRNSYDGIKFKGLYESIAKPFINCLFGDTINPITWFIYALVMMMLLMDLAYYTRYRGKLYFLYFSVSLLVSYFIWGDEIININFTFDSFFRFFPYFILGYIAKNRNWINSVRSDNSIKNIYKSFIFVFTTVLLIYLIMHLSYPFAAPLYFICGILGSLSIINISMILKRSNKLIYTISVGTIIILGLHWMFIGTTNYVIERMLHINHILYNIPISLLLAVAIVFINYYIILFCQKHFKLILGGR